jgi:endonuclease/exonuclease/phosphatase family metal-dependent hydrolase
MTIDKRKQANPLPFIFAGLLLFSVPLLWLLLRPAPRPDAIVEQEPTVFTNPVTHPDDYLAEDSEPPTESVAVTRDTSIVTWNIEWFPGQSPNATAQEARDHMAQVQQAVREIGADIWLLQEMWDRPSVEELFMDLPHEVHVVSGHLHRGELGRMQTAVVSRFPAIDSGWENFVASDGARAPPRGFSWAVLDVHGSPLIVLTTHVKANPGNPFINIRLREESARQMLAKIEQLQERHPEAPVVVGGDFNQLLNQERFADEQTLPMFFDAGFHDTWAGVPFEERVTWPAQRQYGDACFDYILARGLGELRAELITGWEALSDQCL